MISLGISRKDGTNTIFLLEKIATIPGKTRDLITKIDITRLFKDFNLFFGADLIEHGTEFVISQFFKLHSLHITTDTK